MQRNRIGSLVFVVSAAVIVLGFTIDEDPSVDESYQLARGATSTCDTR